MSGDLRAAGSFRRPPTAGRVEIGYGTGGSRRNRGLATAAVAAVLERAARYGVAAVDAETAIANTASQGALERNGFARTGERDDDEEGRVIVWQRVLPA